MYIASIIRDPLMTTIYLDILLCLLGLLNFIFCVS